MAVFAGKTLFVITGASRGIGRTIAVEAAKRCSGDALFLLMARSEPKLKETSDEILKINPKFAVKILPCDLSKVDANSFDPTLEIITASAPFDQSYIFHNAGHTGSIKGALALQDLDYWHKYYHLNFFSTVALTISLTKTLKPLSTKITIVNITSLAGREPFSNLAMYGSGKAARDLYFRVLAKEEPEILVLNYSPGPVDTDMFNGVISDAEGEEIRKMFLEIKEANAVLSTEQTVGKLLDLLEKRDFQSGATIDYYDRI